MHWEMVKDKETTLGLIAFLHAHHMESKLIFVVNGTILPYFGKRKQVTKVTFLVKEQNVSVISTDAMEYHDVLPNISLNRMSVYA